VEEAARNGGRDRSKLLDGVGGNAPFIVFDDADIDEAVDGAMIAKMRNGGQACTAANRFYIQRGVAKPFTEKLIERMGALKLGDGTDPETTLGPWYPRSKSPR